LHSVARADAVELLGTQAGVKVAILPESVQLAQPEPIVGAAAPGFVIRATGKAEAIIDTDALGMLAGRVAGKSDQAALEIVDAIPGVASSDIDVSPGWAPFGLPRKDSRIEVVIVRNSVNGAPAQGGEPSGP
jgi:hypothetical protein